MDQGPRVDRHARELRYLKLYALVSSVMLVGLLLAAFRAPPRHYEEISTERLRILNPDGGHALVLAGKGGLPGPTFEGREYPQELSGGRTGASGMIFFNERGDEVGGLTYQGRLGDDGDGYSASGGITFDQFRQDQVVGISYQDNGEHRSAGLQVWDRSSDIGLGRILELVDARAKATGVARDSVEQIIAGLAEQGLAASRVFLGSRDRTASLVLHDARSRPRIRMFVDSVDVARLEFLDSTGAVISAFPE